MRRILFGLALLFSFVSSADYKIDTAASTASITGGTIDGASIGATTPADGKFTTLESTSTTIFATGSGTSGDVWTSTDATGAGVWQTPAAGADQELSNLTSPTKINEDLINDGLADWTIRTDDDATNNATPTNDLNFKTGNKTAGTGGSGNMLFEPGSSFAGVRGTVTFDAFDIILRDGSEGTIGEVWTSTDNVGGGSWAPLPAAPAPGANTSLSNLTATDINQDLIGDIPGFGSTWNVRTKSDAASDFAIYGSGDSTGGNSGGADLKSGDPSAFNSGNVRVFSAPATASGKSSGDVSGFTGNSTLGGSGDYKLTIGTAGTTQGEFRFLKSGVASVIGDVWTATDTGGEGYWAALPGGGGEANTASNVGAGGVGIFKQKIGVDFELRNVAAASSKISVVLDGANDEVDIDVVEANVSHNALADFISDEHVAHTSVTLTAGTGLTGGGDISANRTFDVANATNGGIGVNADSLQMDIGDLVVDTIAAGDHLAFDDITGGNDDRITFANFEGTLNHDNLAGFVADEHVAHTGVTLTAGIGLTGGGDISANRTFDMDINGLSAPTGADALGDFIAVHNLADAAVRKITISDLDALIGAGAGPTQLADFDPNEATFPATAPAGASSRNEHPILVYDDTIIENVVFHDVLSNAYSGASMTIDIDWIASSATTGDVVWGVEVEAIAAGGHDIDADSFDTQQTAINTTNGTSGIVTRTSIVLTNAEADLIAAGDGFRLRVQRVATSGSDTMVGDAQILRVGMSQ